MRGLCLDGRRGDRQRSLSRTSAGRRPSCSRTTASSRSDLGGGRGEGGRSWSRTSRRRSRAALQIGDAGRVRPTPWSRSTTATTRLRPAPTAARARMTSTWRRHEVWFVTGSQHLYGPETLEHGRRALAEIAAALDARADDPGAGRLQARADRRRTGSAQLVLEANADRDLRRADHVDAHVLAGQDVDRRPRRARSKPFLHLHTQFNREIPWPTIDMDFMNLNQAAHGDREFGFIAARHAARAQGGRRPLAGSGRAGADRRVERAAACARHDWADAADRPLRRQHARGGRHRRRQGRGPAPARVSASTATASATWSPRSTAPPTPRSTSSSRPMSTSTTWSRRFDRAASAPRRCATARGSSSGSARLPRGRRLRRFTDTFEDLHGLTQLPGPRRPAPDGATATGSAPKATGRPPRWCAR